MSQLSLKRLEKSFNEARIIKGIDLDVSEGEFVVFVGPSGCGKSTLLRMIAGLEDVSAGEIEIGGNIVNDLPPVQRGIAMVFQSYALYPHMSVYENIAFPLRVEKLPQAEVDNRVQAAAKVLQLESRLQHRPGQLSGGQRQRVAIGRAIVRGPEVFLFDEPLSNLDAELRVDMRVEIARLHKEIGATMIYVTHDQVEAMTLADKIVVLRGGNIEQVGSPMQLYSDPDNRFVAGFIGSPSMNFVEGIAGDGTVSIAAFGGTAVETSVALPARGEKVLVGLRPQHLKIAASAEGAKVDLCEQLGGVAYSYLICPTGERVIVETKGEEAPVTEGTVAISFDPSSALFFDAETEKRLR